MKNTLRRLEYHKISNMLGEQAGFYGGRKLACALQPATDVELVRQRLAETTECLELLRFQETAFLNDLLDIRPHLGKARAEGALYPMDMLQILQVLRASRLAAGFLSQGEGSRAKWLRNELTPNLPLEEEIREAIDDTGDVKDSASVELRTLRSRLGTLRSRIKDYLRDFVKSTHNQKYLQDALVTERSGRYVVPVKLEYRHEVRGIVHDESSSGATVFIEPEVVVSANNEIRRLEIEETREIEKILRRLTARVAGSADDLAVNMESLEILDFWVAKARLALQMDAHLPRLNAQGRIHLDRARHPLLSSKAVPIDLEMGKKFDILVITGPNTGGKTVSLKTVGLLTIMAQSGLYVPTGMDTELAVFSRILVDIGDEQSIEQSLSTFSSHMTNIKNILEQADAHSLVILDELGAGTDPVEGGALARSIIERLLQLGTKVLVSTHHSELKTLAYQYDKVENACVEFDPVSLRPTYRLTIGLPGQSNAFEIAARLGLDRQLVDQARDYVPQQEMEMSRMLQDLKEMRFQAEVEKEAARALQQTLRKENLDMEKRLEEIEKERELTLTKIKQDATRYLDSARQEIGGILEDFKARAREAETPKWHEIEDMRRRYREVEPRLELPQESKPVSSKQKVNPGDFVEIKSIRQSGHVLSGPNEAGDITVQVGIMRLTVNKKDVILRASPEEKAARVKTQSYLEKRKNVSTEINLRGMLAEEALFAADQYIEDAFMAGLDKIRIIHGKGTGALRKAVREHLAAHPYVQEFRDGEAGEGGNGVTIAHLKR